MIDAHMFDHNHLSPLVTGPSSITPFFSVTSSEVNMRNHTKKSQFVIPADTPLPQLTPSQELVVESCIKLLPQFKIIVIKGDSGSGKYTAIKEVFQRLDAIVENFDLCELSERTSRELSNQDVVEYLNLLLSRLETRMDYLPERKNKTCDSSYEIDHTLELSKAAIPGIIYFRYYNRIADTLTDCYSKVRFLLPLILKTFTEKMPKDIRLIITTHGCMLPEGLHWCLDLITTRSDMEHVLNFYINTSISLQKERSHCGYITRFEADQIMKMSKIIPIGRILYCLKYALAVTSRTSIEFNESQLLTADSVSFLESYKKALSKFSGSTVDVETNVPKPIPEDDLVGVEDIIDEINTSIINPMRLNIPGISIKKGLLLCGPPGTGKTSIGRWLAHQIKGKFYLIGGEAGINGSSLIDTFDSTVKRARDNAPAIIFIDDCDVLFEHDDTYRAFLTILDGIETNKRNDVCVILTCMNLRNVPSSLLRGGRLEMALITRLPDRLKIQIILQQALNKMTQTITDYNEDIGLKISNYVTLDFISNLSIKMNGWNCADIHRCVNDVSRLIISNKGINLPDLFEKCIRQIREQYTLCGRCESTNLDDHTHRSYII